MSTKNALILVLLFIMAILSGDSYANGWILYNRGRFDTLENFSLNATTFDGGQSLKILEGPFLNPKLSRDRRVLFLVVPEWKDKFLFMMIYSYSLERLFQPYRVTPLTGWDGDPRNTTHVMWAGDPVFSPDQTQIIYQFNLIKWEDISQPKIYAHTPQKKFSNGYAPTLAIDPRAFLALARTDGSDAIHPIPIELPGQAVGYSWCQPDWHPYDRQKIAVSFLNAFPGYQDFTIYITNPEGTSIQSLLNPVNNPALIERHRSPAWSPDGNHIAYVRQVGNQYAIFIVRADGADSPGLQITPTNIVQLAPIPDIGTYFFDAIKEVCWSPDGNYLAFSVYSHANQQVPMGYDIYTTRRDGSQLTRITTAGDAAYPEWYTSAYPLDATLFALPDSIQAIPTATLAGPTNTPIPVVPNATPTPVVPSPTPVSFPSLPFIQYEFDKNSLEENGWNVIPGGFVPGTPAGSIRTGDFPLSSVPSSRDQRGILISVEPQQVAFLYANTPISTQGKPILVRMALTANSGNASVTLGVLKGLMQQTDGSISYQMTSSTRRYLHTEGILTLLYEPDEGTQATPLIQVASSAQTGTVTVSIDRLDVFILENNQAYPSSMFR